MPQVSVVMSCFNASATVTEAVESILTQSFGYFEFIILDDGSKDDTSRILESFDDSRIRLVLHRDQAGLTARLREGFSLCRAPFVARMDADDISYPERLTRQLAALHDTGADVVFSHARILDASGRVTGATGGHLSKGNALIHLRNAGNVFIHPTAVMRRNAYDVVGGYDARLRTRQDYDLWLRMLENGSHLHVLPEKLLGLRVHAGSLSSSGRKNWVLNTVVSAMSELRSEGMFAEPDALSETASGLAPVQRYVDGVEIRRELKKWRPALRILLAAKLLLTLRGRFIRAIFAPGSLATAKDAVVREARQENPPRP